MPTLPFLLSLLNITVENILPATRRKLLLKELLNNAWTAAITSFFDLHLMGRSLSRLQVSRSPLFYSPNRSSSRSHNYTQLYDGWRYPPVPRPAIFSFLSCGSDLHLSIILK